MKSTSCSNVYLLSFCFKLSLKFSTILFYIILFVLIFCFPIFTDTTSVSDYTNSNPCSGYSYRISSFLLNSELVTVEDEVYQCSV